MSYPVCIIMEINGAHSQCHDRAGHGMDEINNLPWEHFIQLFGNVVEHGPIVAGAIWGRRPFASPKELHEAVCEFLDNLPSRGKESILRCHPDLAGRLAKADCLTAESKQEQTSAGLLTLTKEESELIATLNTQYKEKFQFPFVVCARENKKEMIITSLMARNQNSRDEELEKGLDEVKKIAWIRLLDLILKVSGSLAPKY